MRNLTATLLFAALLTLAGASTGQDDNAAAQPEFAETAPPNVDYTPENAPQEAPEGDDVISKTNAELDRLNAERGGEGPGNSTNDSMNLDWKTSILKTFGWLCVIIAAILVLFYLTKRWGKNTPLLAGMGLGTVLGRVALSPRVFLYFVRAAGRVLVIGVTPNSISLISEFDAASFEEETKTKPEPAEGAPKTKTETNAPAKEQTARSAGFLSHLKASTRDLLNETTPKKEQAPLRESDADIESLRKDILRLQEYLKDNLREE